MISHSHRLLFSWPSFGLVTSLLFLTVFVQTHDELKSEMAKAATFEAAGDLSAANNLYQKLLEQEPQRIEPVRNLAINFSLMGEFDDALRYQRMAVEMEPNDAQCWVELGFNYLNHQRDKKQGLHAMRKAVQLDPSPRNRTFLAQALFVNEDTRTATMELRSVMRQSPGYSYASLVFGRQARPDGWLRVES